MTPQVQAAPPEQSSSAKGREVKAPMVGTFYRSPAPEEPPFVEVGDTVNKGDVICIIEAMKLMNEVKAEFGGKITEISAENADPVEFGQTIFIIDPQS
jgi:acetyl-CoA carboxylase biotin carboxyl carrier protein